MSLPIFFYFLILSLFFKLSHSTAILVDGSSEWKNPTVSIGDSITFKHKQNYNLYIFKNQEAFNLCNFTQANLLTDPSTTSYTWHPSRVGFFYFTFSSDSLKACQDSQKLAIKVTPTKASAPEASSPMPTTPAPSSGGDIQSSPSFPWPFRPHQGSSPGPAPTPEASSPITLPLVPYKGSGDNMPFINSNPAVPLPTGEVDSATIHPLATSGYQGQVMIGLRSFGIHAAVHIMALLLL